MEPDKKLKDPDKSVEEILARENPELLFKLKEIRGDRPSEAEFSPSGLYKAIILVSIIFSTIAYFSQRYGFSIFFLGIGLVLIGYGIYTIITKKAEIDYGYNSHSLAEKRIVNGGLASLMGVVYIFLGLLFFAIFFFVK